MTYVIQLEGLADGRLAEDVRGSFIQSFDCEEGLVITDHIENAKEFDDQTEAMRFWKTECPQGVQGHNLGGKNRPMTAFTVSIVPVEDAVTTTP